MRSLVHHRPAGRPLSARLSGFLTGLSLLLRGRVSRLAGGALLTTTVIGLVLAIPVVSGADGRTAPSVTLDASSSAAASSEDSPVVMGLDGSPLSSSAFAGVTTSGTASSAPTTAASPPSAEPESGEPEADAPAVAAAPDTTGSTPAGSPSTEGTTAPGSPARSSTGSPSSEGSTSSGSSSAAGSSSSSSSSSSEDSSSSSSSSSGPTARSEEEPAAAAEAPDLHSAAEVLALVNAERATAGCDALVADAGLTAAAQAHSAWMSQVGVLGLDELDAEAEAEAATIAQGRPNPHAVVSGWLHDADDRAAILDCSLTSVGIGVVDGWWTQLLA